MPTPWRDQLAKQASYKAVPFFYDSHEFTGGKRIVDHLFPYRDAPFTESLGKKQRVFTIDAYVLGEDYFKQRDKLLEALESDGAGTLIHPYLGKKNVDVVDFTLTESSAEGGIARISITFHETSAQPSADIGFDVPKRAEGVTAKIEKSLVEEFLGFSADDLSDINLGRITDIVNKGIDEIYAAREYIPAGDFGISELAFAVGGAKRGVRSLLSKPIELAGFVVASARLLKSTLTFEGLGPQDQIGRDLLKDPNAFREAVFGARRKRTSLKGPIGIKAVFPNYEGDTISKIQLRENTRLYGNLLKGVMIATLAEVSMQTIYATYQEAVDHRNYLVSEIEELLSDPLISDETYQNFQDLIVLILDGIPSEFVSERRLSKININAALPSLSLSYDLYESLQLEADLVSRNRIPNPAFFKVGQVEVVAGD